VGGCTNCKGKSGCDDRKGAMFATLDATLAALYPTKTWGELDDDLIGGVGPDDVAALADELATELEAATFVVPGGEHEPCDRIYVLAVGRPPCAIQVRDAGVPPPDEWAAAPGGIREQYLRISLSQLARVVAVQQVAIDVDATPDGYLIRERPRAGVFDAPFLRRMQRLVAVLPAYDLTHLDFGEIAGPPPGFSAGDWAARWGAGVADAAPSIWSYLFSPEPAATISTGYVVAGARPHERDRNPSSAVRSQDAR
jgi:hypothetical protein